jgi:hypothetical protein
MILKSKQAEEKPRGWANLQQQLKEIRDESFKQGVWRGREEGARLQREEILSEEFRNELWKQSKHAKEFPKDWFVIPTLDVIEELKQKITPTLKSSQLLISTNNSQISNKGEQNE